MADGVPSPTWVDSITAERPIIGQKMNVPSMLFSELVRDRYIHDPNRLQYVTAEGKKYTLDAFYNLSLNVARSLVTLGLQPSEGVCILGFNCVEWFAVDVGTALASCISSGIYTTNSPDACAYVINHSSSRVVFVDDDAALQKIMSVLSQCPRVIKVVIWGEYDAANYAEQYPDLAPQKIMAWSDFLGCGDTDIANTINMREREEKISPKSVCKLIYTSGTTGRPKAVMISHDNIVFVSIHFGKLINSTNGDRVISFLPLSHIAANTVDICGAIASGFTVYLADRNALKGTLRDTMLKVRPTLFLAIPRAYEKFQEAMVAAGASATGLKKRIAVWAKGVGTAASHAKEQGLPMPWGYTIAKKLVFSKVLERLGLDECRMLVNASAPLLDVTDRYFKSLDIRIHDLYGMSEATGPLSANYPDYKPGTSGKLLDGIEYKLVNTIAEDEGELCFRGRNMFMGYLNNPSESEKTIDDEGFVHSGDIGKVDEDRFITITGRAKDLIITAGGENVAPTNVESTLLSAMPAVGRAFVVGDKRKFVGALIIPRMDEDGKLIGAAAQVSEGVETGKGTATDVNWLEYVRLGVERANEDAISNAAKVKKFAILEEDFSQALNELTPTMKVKRNVVEEQRKDIIDGLYE